jgi:hypothetical protein
MLERMAPLHARNEGDRVAGLHLAVALLLEATACALGLVEWHDHRRNYWVTPAEFCSSNHSLAQGELPVVALKERTCSPTTRGVQLHPPQHALGVDQATECWAGDLDGVHESAEVGELHGVVSGCLAEATAVHDDRSAEGWSLEAARAGSPVGGHLGDAVALDEDREVATVPVNEEVGSTPSTTIEVIGQPWTEDDRGAIGKSRTSGCSCCCAVGFGDLDEWRRPGTHSVEDDAPMRTGSISPLEHDV